MTVIEFGKRDAQLHFWTVAMLILVTLSLAYGIVTYSAIINVRHDLSQAQKTVAQAQVANAELKNKLYAMLDSISEGSFAQEHGLVIEQNPRYVEMTSLVSGRRP